MTSTVDTSRDVNVANNLSALNKKSYEIKFELNNSDYEAVENIGSGAYGVVCSAIHRLTRQRVAIKKIADIFEQLTVAVRTYREIKILRHFKHDNVISIQDILRPNAGDWVSFRDVYIVLDLMETDLHRIIYSKQELTEEHVRYFLYQICRGLKYIHSANVVHRDLKPSNLLVNENCDLKIGDFGMARGLQSSIEEVGGKLMTQYVATRWYRAPELLLPLNYTAAVDIWSTGCILAEMVGRKQLFPGTHWQNQLRLIFDVVGTPSDSFFTLINSQSSFIADHLWSSVKKAPKDLHELYPTASADLVSLLGQMLVFDPRDRCSAEQALQSAFLSKYHDPLDEPVCVPVFDFGFEQNLVKEKDSSANLRKLIVNEMKDYDKPNILSTLTYSLKPVPLNEISQPITFELTKVNEPIGFELTKVSEPISYLNASTCQPVEDETAEVCMNEMHTLRNTCNKLSHEVINNIYLNQSCKNRISEQCLSTESIKSTSKSEQNVSVVQKLKQSSSVPHFKDTSSKEIDLNLICIVGNHSRVEERNNLQLNQDVVMLSAVKEQSKLTAERSLVMDKDSTSFSCNDNESSSHTSRASCIRIQTDLIEDDIEMLSARIKQLTTTPKREEASTNSVTDKSLTKAESVLPSNAHDIHTKIDTTVNNSSESNNIGHSYSTSTLTVCTAMQDAKEKIRAALLNSGRKRQQIEHQRVMTSLNKITVTAQQRSIERKERKRLKMKNAKERNSRKKKQECDNMQILTQDDKNLLEKWKKMSNEKIQQNRTPCIEKEASQTNQFSYGENMISTIKNINGSLIPYIMLEWKAHESMNQEHTGKDLISQKGNINVSRCPVSTADLKFPPHSHRTKFNEEHSVSTGIHNAGLDSVQRTYHSSVQHSIGFPLSDHLENHFTQDQVQTMVADRECDSHELSMNDISEVISKHLKQLISGTNSANDELNVRPNSGVLNEIKRTLLFDRNSALDDMQLSHLSFNSLNNQTKQILSDDEISNSVIPNELIRMLSNSSMEDSSELSKELFADWNSLVADSFIWMSESQLDKQSSLTAPAAAAANHSCLLSSCSLNDKTLFESTAVENSHSKRMKDEKHLNSIGSLLPFISQNDESINSNADIHLLNENPNIQLLNKHNWISPTSQFKLSSEYFPTVATSIKTDSNFISTDVKAQQSSLVRHMNIDISFSNALSSASQDDELSHFTSSDCSASYLSNELDVYEVPRSSEPLCSADSAPLSALLADWRSVLQEDELTESTGHGIDLVRELQSLHSPNINLSDLSPSISK